jgi:hypothetical protein
MARSLVSKSISSRLQEANFSELTSSETLGPNLSNSTVQGEAIMPAPVNNVSVNQWVAMTQADQGLLDSIYDFINTTKEGVAVVPDALNGRTKKLYFNFYGTMGKSVKPGEIGQFEVNFYYPPNTATSGGLGTEVG